VCSCFDRNSRSLIKKLLQSDLTKRIGCFKNGATDVSNHKWFSSSPCMEWDQLLNRELHAPVKPAVTGESDTSNFEQYPESMEEETPFPQYTNFSHDPFDEF
jgi:hypothetical protein